MTQCRALRLTIDRKHAPDRWVRSILENADERSRELLQKHLVGATLERRFGADVAPGPRTHAAGLGASGGDFVFPQVVYHVATTLSRLVMGRCAASIRAGQRPVLLVRDEEKDGAKAVANYEGLGDLLTVLSVEEFIAKQVIDLVLDFINTATHVD
jgi:hypothetical protein